MARAIDLLADHWAKTKGERRSHTLDLAGGGKLTVWWSPWTLGQQDRVFGDMQPGEGFRPARFAKVVLVKSEAEDGSRLFADIEEIELTSRVSPEQIKALAGPMLASLQADNTAAAPATDGEGGEEGNDGPKT